MNEKVLKELNKELQGVIMGQKEIMKLVEIAKDYKIIDLLDTTLKECVISIVLNTIPSAI